MARDDVRHRFWRNNAAMKKWKARGRELMEKVVTELLDDLQQTIWKEMTGEPFGFR